MDKRRAIQIMVKRLVAIRSYEEAFHRYNFMHLTGIKANNTGVDSAIHFYEKCLANRLAENDFDFAKDGFQKKLKSC